MFTNKISMSKPACIKFPTKKLQNFYNNQYRGHSAICWHINLAYSTQSSDSRRLLDEVQVQTKSVYYESRRN